MKLPSFFKFGGPAIIIAGLLNGCTSKYQEKVKNTLNFNPLSKTVDTEYKNINITKISDTEYKITGKPGTYFVLTKGALENGSVSNKQIIEENNDQFGSSASTSNEPYKMVQIPENGNTILEIDGYKITVEPKK